MSELFLIAHKVRGEAAFDVAVRIEEGTVTDPGPWWVIPTSGHRAYPYWFRNLQVCVDTAYGQGSFDFRVETMPPDLRDHYAENWHQALRKHYEPAPSAKITEIEL